jgi:uncharacterized protein (TIGR02594 family)
MLVKTRIMLAAGCVSLLALSIPAFSQTAPRGVEADRAQISLSARTHTPMFGWPALVAEARKYMGTNPTDRKRLWCATFMNMVLAKVGYSGTNSDAAKSFAYYGRRISEPKVGAIAVLTRGKRGGHVGVVSGIDAHGNPIIISGNHNKRVGESVYSRSRVIAYVMPTERGPAATMVADRGPVSRTASDIQLESPITELLAAIEAEQSRAEVPRPAATRAQPLAQTQPIAQAQPIPPQRVVQPVPHRMVQQMPEQPVQPQGTRRVLPLDPALAGLFGLVERAQAARSPQPASLRAVPPRQSGRVATADNGAMTRR